MTLPPEADPNTVQVYRSTDSGQTWTMVAQIAAGEGFAMNGAADSYPMVSAIRDDAVHVAMLGHAAFDVQQIVWFSSDGGQTWLQTVNAADPMDEFGDWMVYGPGGIHALPARGIVIPQPTAGLQVSILG